MTSSDARKTDNGPAARKSWSKPAVWTLIATTVFSVLSLTVLASVAIDEVTEQSNVNRCVREVRNGTDKAKLEAADVTLVFLQDATDDGEITRVTRDEIDRVQVVVDDARMQLDENIDACEKQNGLFPW